MCRGEKKFLLLVLAVNLGQRWSELAEQRGGGRLVVDEDARAECGGGGAIAGLRDDVALDDQFVGESDVNAGLAKPDQQFAPTIGVFAFRREDGGEAGTLRATADRLGRAFIAKQQTDGLDNDGLAAAGLAGEQVETGVEVQFQPVDQSEVFNSQVAQPPESVLGASV